MTDFEIARLGFHARAVREWAESNASHTNWPVVYVLDKSDPRQLPLIEKGH